MKKYLSLSLKSLLLLALILVCSACGKQYVGMHYNTSGWSQIYRLPANGTQNDKWFNWEYSIEKGSKENEYILKGIASGSRNGSKSFNRILLNESRFSLILANNGTVVDNIAFRMMGDEINAPVPFKKTFECQNSFDAAAIFWNAKIR